MKSSSRSRKHFSHRLVSSLIAAAVLLVGVDVVVAKRSPLDLSILGRDGYGVVPISRPRPNDMIVRGTINGKNATLILDTGWGDQGVSVDASYAKSLNLAMTGVKGAGAGFSGVITHTEKAAPGTVVLGNVQLTDVPLIVGAFGGLQSRANVADAKGFVGAQFLHAASAIIDLPNFCLYLRPPGKGRLASLGPR